MVAECVNEQCFVKLFFFVYFLAVSYKKVNTVPVIPSWPRVALMTVDL